ncbi:hypothetical protein MPH_09693 [Macrophomina phaseolina MS6]|uniref:Uncharacterized protein n=1 Tax=Macrophomina phaseolina (strain MS6) TaxID=1126212 RepID=K2RET6_MACPH|nr:hypothetical protein MPH_09693 [Macrophomina phaseolina MS6]
MIPAEGPIQSFRTARAPLHRISKPNFWICLAWPRTRMTSRSYLLILSLISLTLKIYQSTLRISQITSMISQRMNLGQRPTTGFPSLSLGQRRPLMLLPLDLMTRPYLRKQRGLRHRLLLPRVSPIQLLPITVYVAIAGLTHAQMAMTAWRGQAQTVARRLTAAATALTLGTIIRFSWIWPSR